MKEDAEGIGKKGRDGTVGRKGRDGREAERNEIEGKED